MPREPKIAETMRRYLRTMGPRHNAVRLTAEQIEKLTDAELLHRDGADVLRFEGQRIEVFEAGEAPEPEPPDPVHARVDDPDTSQEALASFNKSGRAMTVLRELLNGPGDTGAIGKRIGRPRENTSPVFCKLVAAHMIRIDGKASGEKSAGTGDRNLYWITDYGRAYLAQIALELTP